MNLRKLPLIERQIYHELYCSHIKKSKILSFFHFQTMPLKTIRDGHETVIGYHHETETHPFIYVFNSLTTSIYMVYKTFYSLAVEIYTFFSNILKSIDYIIKTYFIGVGNYFVQQVTVLLYLTLLIFFLINFSTKWKRRHKKFSRTGFGKLLIDWWLFAIFTSCLKQTEFKSKF